MTEKQSAETGFIVIGRLKIDLLGRCVWLNGELVMLTPLEFDALVCLAHHAGRCLSPADLLREVWGCELGGTDAQVHSCLKRLRRKLFALTSDATPYIIRYHGYYRTLTDAEWRRLKA